MTNKTNENAESGKRPITHVVWFTLVVLTLALGVSQGLGDLVRAHFVADRPFTGRYFVIAGYVLTAVIAGAAGYKLLPIGGRLTLLRALAWCIYASIILNVIHWVIFATLTQGWYAMDWANTVIPAVLCYAVLGLLVLCVWGVSKLCKKPVKSS